MRFPLVTGNMYIGYLLVHEFPFFPQQEFELILVVRPVKILSLLDLVTVFFSFYNQHVLCH